ncbi:MAG: hypothetical protein V7707_14295 [Motiliproteus sp.]
MTIRPWICAAMLLILSGCQPIDYSFEQRDEPNGVQVFTFTSDNAPPIEAMEDGTPSDPKQVNTIFSIVGQLWPVDGIVPQRVERNIARWDLPGGGELVFKMRECKKYRCIDEVVVSPSPK